MRALISAAIRACDAATRAFEAMADAYDEFGAAHEQVRETQQVLVNLHRSSIEANEAFQVAERARKEHYDPAPKVEVHTYEPKEEERNYVWALRKAKEGYYVQRAGWAALVWIHNDGHLMIGSRRERDAVLGREPYITVRDQLATDWVDCGKVEP